MNSRSPCVRLGFRVLCEPLSFKRCCISPGNKTTRFCTLFTDYQKSSVFLCQLLQKRFFWNKDMPKKDKPSKGAKAQSEETKSGPVSRNKSGGISIAVHAKPGSKQNAITDVSSEAVGVAIAAPPTDGEANSELVRYLSKVLNVKKSEIVLDKGSRSREKIINVSGTLSPEEILERLKAESTQ